MEPQEPPRDDRNGVLLVVDVRHESAQVSVDEIGKVLVSDAGHAVAHYAHRHARGELQPEGDTVEEGERCAERVADNCDRRRMVRRESTPDGRENGLRGFGMFLGETVVGFDRGWDSGEERGVEWLEDEISVGQVGKAGRMFVTVSAIEE